jgi:hypothetical protein
MRLGRFAEAGLKRVTALALPLLLAPIAARAALVLAMGLGFVPLGWYVVPTRDERVFIASRLGLALGA